MPFMAFDVASFRQQFPILSDKNNFGKSLIYFDNAATTQKPQTVIDAITDYLTHKNANVHRGVHYLSFLSDKIYDDTREQIAALIGASSAKEIVFTSGATDGINQIARCFLPLSRSDEVILFEQEHHSNIVPWIETGATIKVVKMTALGDYDLESLKSCISSRTKIVSVAHIANVLGTISPIKAIAEIAHEAGAYLVVDGAQTLAHGPIDVNQMGCDFFVTSGHKCFGPTGIGFLYGRYDLLKKMRPFRFGGGMVERVDFSHATYKLPPEGFEAGTPNVMAIAGLQAALNLLQTIDWSGAQLHQEQLTRRLIEVISSNKNYCALKPHNHRVGIVSFTHHSIHPHDIASIADSDGIAIRAGNHCAQPLMRILGVNGTARISLALYNTLQEVEKLSETLEKIDKILR